MIFVLGGARSGKSRFAEQTAKELASGSATGRGNTSVLYVATATACDDEMAERIRKHREDRPSDWQTVEEPRDVAGALQRAELTPDSIVLIDCLTLYVTNHLLPEGCMEEGELTWNPEAAELAVEALLLEIERSEGTVILVSNEVGLGLVPDHPLGRVFRDVAGRANQRAAAVAQRVVLLVAGIPVEIKS